MLCATIYEYRTTPTQKDVEASNVSNNNDRLGSFVNKNLNQDRRISMGQDNGDELIEKGKDPQKDLPNHPKKDEKGGVVFIFNIARYATWGGKCDTYGVSSEDSWVNFLKFKYRVKDPITVTLRIDCGIILYFLYLLMKSTSFSFYLVLFNLDLKILLFPRSLAPVPVGLQSHRERK